MRNLLGECTTNRMSVVTGGAELEMDAGWGWCPEIPFSPEAWDIGSLMYQWMGEDVLDPGAL